MTDWTDNAAFDAILVGGRDPAMAEAIALAGGTLASRIDWNESVVASPGVILILDTTGVDDDTVANVLPEVAERADVVSCTLDQLDLVSAALLFTDAQFLCAPTMADRVAALAVAAGLAGRDAAPRVREDQADEGAARLKRFRGEVARIAGVLARLAEDDGTGGVSERHMTFDAGPAEAVIEPQAIRAALRARRLRDGFFGEGLFEDPAWDMLLDLFAAELEGARVSVSSLCIAAAVAPTTALRWLNRLVGEGLLERRPDTQDKRRAFVALSAAGSEAMRGYLAALDRNGLALG